MNEEKIFICSAQIWRYEGAAGWHFVTLPVQLSDEIKQLFGVMKRGWGSLPVSVTIGTTTWKTSIFPDKKAGAYLLPLKAEIRKKTRVKAGDTITLILEVRV